MTNRYTVNPQIFFKIKRVGNYVIMWCLLEDRIHIEMAIENATFVTQTFKTSIKKYIEEKAQNYTSDPIKMYLRMQFSNSTYYRFYPTKEQEEEFMKIKLYERLVVREVEQVNDYDPLDCVTMEDDYNIETYYNDKLIMRAEKI